jgi:hypothetical protein
MPTSPSMTRAIGPPSIASSISSTPRSSGSRPMTAFDPAEIGKPPPPIQYQSYRRTRAISRPSREPGAARAMRAPLFAADATGDCGRRSRGGTRQSTRRCSKEARYAGGARQCSSPAPGAAA